MGKWIRRVSILVVLLPIAWLGFQYWSITQIGENSAPKEADVIIILGAAVWPTGPSPALQARVYHGSSVYKKGFSPNIIVTGGLGVNPPTEAEAMYNALIALGVESHVILLEDQATNTRENLAFSKEIMDTNGWRTAIIVSDTFHLKRALLIASDFGIEAYGAPAKNSVLYQKIDRRVGYTLREVLAVTQYYSYKFFSF